MTKKQWILVLVFNVLIALGFFVSNLGAGYERLSSDLHNIVPMCQKFDDTSLFKGDVFAGDTDNFKYYIPFFVQKLRALSWITGGDYVAVLNLWLAFAHILFGLGWFLVLHKVFRNQFWIAFLISILIRGIVWLPGYEIWGISNLWSLMPRTVYASLLPFALLLLLKTKKRVLLTGGFFIGLIFNFHPISGLGGVLFYYVLLGCLKWIFKKEVSWKQISVSVVLTVLGMLPFLLTYFSKTDLVMNYDQQAYQEAFSARIPSFFSNKQQFFSRWMRLKFLFFVLPLIAYLLLGILKKGVHLKRAVTLLIITITLVIVPNLSLPVEQWVNAAFGSNLRMSFQLVRVQKLAILPAYAAIGFLMIFVVAHFRFAEKSLPFFVLSYIILGLISASGGLSSMPFIGDDITREIYPDLKSIIDGSVFKETDFDKMSAYIENNTLETDVFFASYMYRSSAKRAVVLDNKGASILIEGNPVGLIDWYKEMSTFRMLSPSEKIIFLENRKVTYIVTKSDEFDAVLQSLHQEGAIKLYRVKG